MSAPSMSPSSRPHAVRLPGERGFCVLLVGLLVLAAIGSARRPVRVIDNHGEASDPVNLPRAMWASLPELRIDVNTATVHELRLLPGVGETLARYIVQARQSGPFDSLTELDRVHRVGPRLIERMSPFATVGDLQDSAGAFDVAIEPASSDGSLEEPR